MNEHLVEEEMLYNKHFVIIIIESLWSEGNGKFAFLKWIFPLLRIQN